MSGAPLAWELAVFLVLSTCSSLLVSAHICLWYYTCDSSIVTQIYYDRHVEQDTKNVAPLQRLCDTTTSVNKHVP